MDKYCSCILLFIAGCALTDALFNNENLDSVFLRLYNRNDTHRDFSLANADQIVPYLASNKSTIIYIHGHTESVDKDTVTPITDALLQYTKENIIALDYRQVASLIYPLSVAQVPALGAAVARSIEKMVQAGLNAESIYVVGHSLGAQIAGYISRNLKFKLTRITGLDPAGPLYYIENRHLSASDAKFVDIIHTDAGILGLALVTGSADFFPNFGHGLQPGCNVNISTTELCNHHRSWRFYIDSLKNKDAFVAVKCPNGFQYASGLCNENERAIMGYYASPDRKGTYYLRTAAQEPFGLGSEGATFKLSE